jgi:hypothetical protein
MVAGVVAIEDAETGEFAFGAVGFFKKGDRFIFKSSATLKASTDGGTLYAQNGTYCFTELPASRSAEGP